MLPDRPAGTVAVLVTIGETPHAIPVSAVLRAGPDRLLLGLADGRGSLARLREDPRVAVALLAAGMALNVRARARDAAVRAGLARLAGHEH
jgi:flavin reductase (DIM6/NTAB) family NADH-FMN oxidoreductase RutF